MPGKEPAAPRETTRQSVRLEVLDGGLEFEIRERGATVWVSLSGALDGERLAELKRRVRPCLQCRERRLVLDGRRLLHLDYRCVTALLAWNDDLRSFSHQLLLYGWSSYLRAILTVEDWSQQLSPGPLPLSVGGAAAFAGPERGR